MNYTALIFDLDGTLANTLPDLAASVNATRRELGYEAVSEERVRESLGHGIIMLLQRSIPEADPHRIVDRFRMHYDRNLVGQTHLYAGVHDVLAELYAAGCKMAVLTNKVEEAAVRLLEKLEVAKYFKLVAGGNGVRALKPDPEPFELAFSTLGCRKEEVLMVGDGGPDIEGAHAVGIDACGILYGYGRPETLKGLNPKFLIARFDELRTIVRG